MKLRNTTDGMYDPSDSAVAHVMSAEPLPDGRKTVVGPHGSLFIQSKINPVNWIEEKTGDVWRETI